MIFVNRSYFCLGMDLCLRSSLLKLDVDLLGLANSGLQLCATYLVYLSGAFQYVAGKGCAGTFVNVWLLIIVHGHLIESRMV